MNNHYSELVINKLLEENRQLKQIIKNNKINNCKLELTEKLNMIRFIFSIAKNLESRIVLFGDFLDNFLLRKSIKRNNLEFYFITDDQSFNQKFLHLLNNVDYIKKKEGIEYDNQLTKTTYSVNKNNIKFKMSFYNYYPKNFSNFDFFNVQNIELDSIYGLKIKKITTNNYINNITDGVISLIDIMKSLYLTEATTNKIINQNNLSSFIDKQKEFMDKGFQINNGVKIIDLTEKCSICYEPGLKGVLLSCRHSFCIDCICKHLNVCNEDRDLEHIDKKCPLCRSTIDLIFD